MRRQAEFIGEDGSMGLTNGCTYTITELPIHNSLIWLRVGDTNIPYTSVTSVLNNWTFFKNTY